MAGVLALKLFICLFPTWAHTKLNGNSPIYSNIWVAKVEGGKEVAQNVAKQLRFTYKGEIGQSLDYYEFMLEDHPEMDPHHSNHLTQSFLKLKEVKWAKQQLLVNRVQTDIWQYTDDAQEDKLNYFLNKEAARRSKECLDDFIWTNIRFPYSIYTYVKSLQQGHVSRLGSFSTKPIIFPEHSTGPDNQDIRNFGLLSKKISAYALMFNDPYWRRQWYMQDYRTTNIPVMDINVVPVWKKGYTGKGVTVAIVDDGIDDHPDIRHSINTDLCYDICKDIYHSCKPRGWGYWKDEHGTNCAGVISMAPNNRLCGVGIAYDAKIVGIRMICEKPTTEASTMKGLTHHMNEIDIYTNSWGYGGTGKDIFVLDEISKEAYKVGSTQGREGKGCIYLHSAGNGKKKGENCAVDCNINQSYVIAIAAATQWGKTTYYSERCAAIMATMYSRNSGNDGVVTTNPLGGCTRMFDGTSSACPQAAAVIALVLQANKDLTYRDVMHLITMSAEVAPLADNRDTWYQNGRGFWVSNDFGFGLMNAENMVNLALDWQNVPPKHTCIVTVKLTKPQLLSKGTPVTVPFYNSACEGSETDEVNYLEHVEVDSTVAFCYRGHVKLHIVSAEGTTSELLEPRLKDNDKDGLEGFTIMSTHNWGEDPKGTWKIIVSVSVDSKPSCTGLVKEFTIKFHGTAMMPAHYEKKREYASFHLPKKD